MKNLLLAAVLAVASIGAHAQASAIPPGWDSYTPQQKQEYNTRRAEALHTQVAVTLDEQRGPSECGGEKFRELWQASYSEKRLAEGDAKAAEDPRYADKPAFQAHERKVAAQEQAAYVRIKAQAMAACHG
ncbi:hypothetical protein [Paraburkholderia heleia]|uniref:hypothetical protein n=1 Tax=Paraburkholderia heleia TaxID=634127 RepID=UPI0005A7B40B|nr:hypothetical protein [Paraburkholderia heleia]